MRLESTMNTKKIMPSSHFPNIDVKTVSGEILSLGKVSDGYDWQLIVVYRGKHCPLCTRYLNELNDHIPTLASLNIEVVALSGDSLSQVTEHAMQFELNAPLGYGLTLEQMQKLGLYISQPRSSTETDHPFSEPGLFVINQQREVVVVDISNTPFTRPQLSTLVSGLSFIKNPDNHYPIRGTHA